MSMTKREPEGRRWETRARVVWEMEERWWYAIEHWEWNR